jgi:tripartite-type tricarboxylate transporter receptor subunit TctC
VAATLATAAVSRRLNELAHIPVVDRPAEFGRFLRAKIASLAKVVKDPGLRAD